MKKALLMMFIFCAMLASAQTYTTITASNIHDAAGNKLASGQLCFTATDSNDQPLAAFTAPDGAVVKKPVCTSISNGAIGTFKTVNTALTTPTNVCLRATVVDSATRQEVLRFKCVQPTGTTFSLDTYTPTSTPLTQVSPTILTSNNNYTGSNSHSGTETFENINAIQYVTSNTTGADWCAKVANAITRLPAGGGMVDAIALQGAQSCASNFASGVTVPVLVLQGASTITSSVSISLPSNMTVLGRGKALSKWVFSTSSELPYGFLVSNAAQHVELGAMTISGSGNSAAIGVEIVSSSGNVASASYSQDVYVHDNLVTGFSKSSTAPAGGIYAALTQGVRIEKNEFTANGNGAAALSGWIGNWNSSQSVGDILINGSDPTWTARRFVIKDNYVHDSLTTGSIRAFNLYESEVSGNWIDENNTMWQPQFTVDTVGNSGAVRSANVATIKLTIPAPSTTIAVGDKVWVSGVTDSTFNVNAAAVTAITVDGSQNVLTFSYSNSGSNTTSGSGTVRGGGLKNGGEGIIIYSQSFSNIGMRNRVTNNHVQNTGGFGIYLQASTRNIVSHNFLENNVQQLVVGSLQVGAISVQGSDSGVRESIDVTDNVIRDVNPGNVNGTGAGDGISTATTSGAVIGNNTITNAWRDGIRISNGDSSPTVVGNTINSSSHGISFPLTVTGATVIGNTIIYWGQQSGSYHGIYFAGASTDVTVSGNILLASSTTGQAGIIATNASATRFSIENNTVMQKVAIPITNSSLTSNVATFTVPSTGWMRVGMTIVVTGSTHNAAFNGTWTISGISNATQLTAAITNADIGSAADAATLTYTGGSGGNAIDWRGLHARIAGNIVNSTAVGISVSGANATATVENNDIIAAVSNPLVANGASSANVVRNNRFLGGGSMTIANAVHCYGNVSGTTTPYQWGDASCATLVQIDRSTGLLTAFNGIKIGSSGSTISDTRELVQSMHGCGTTTTCANTANASYREIWGTVALSSGTATVTSISPAFTSTSSFSCQAQDNTAANLARCVPASTTSITCTGTTTDTVAYVCRGN